MSKRLWDTNKTSLLIVIRWLQIESVSQRLPDDSGGGDHPLMQMNHSVCSFSFAGDRTEIRDARLRRHFVVQVILHEPPADMATTGLDNQGHSAQNPVPVERPEGCASEQQ